jgi:hypothetical protein
METLQEIIDSLGDTIKTITDMVDTIKTISTSILNVLPYDIRVVVFTFLPIFVCLIFLKLYGKAKGN